MAHFTDYRVQRLPAVWKTQVRSLGWEDLLEKEMATHSSILAWKIPWTEDWATSLDSVNVTFTCTGKLKSSWDSLDRVICLTTVVWDQTHTTSKVCLCKIMKCLCISPYFNDLKLKVFTLNGSEIKIISWLIDAGHSTCGLPTHYLSICELYLYSLFHVCTRQIHDLKIYIMSV